MRPMEMASGQMCSVHVFFLDGVTVKIKKNVILLFLTLNNWYSSKIFLVNVFWFCFFVSFCSGYVTQNRCKHFMIIACMHLSLWHCCDFILISGTSWAITNMSNKLQHKDLQCEHITLEILTYSDDKSSTFSFPAHRRFLTMIYLSGYIIGSTVGWLSPTHSFSLNALHNNSVKKKKRKKKLCMRRSWQRARREGENDRI